MTVSRLLNGLEAIFDWEGDRYLLEILPETEDQKTALVSMATWIDWTCTKSAAIFHEDFKDLWLGNDKFQGDKRLVVKFHGALCRVERAVAILQGRFLFKVKFRHGTLSEHHRTTLVNVGAVTSPWSHTLRDSPIYSSQYGSLQINRALKAPHRWTFIKYGAVLDQDQNLNDLLERNRLSIQHGARADM